jgi:hypothetical protein
MFNDAVSFQKNWWPVPDVLKRTGHQFHFRSLIGNCCSSKYDAFYFWKIPKSKSLIGHHFWFYGFDNPQMWIWFRDRFWVPPFVVNDSHSLSPILGENITFLRTATVNCADINKCDAVWFHSGDFLWLLF